MYSYHTIQQLYCTVWYLPKGVANSCLHENLYMDSYSNLFIIAKMLKQQDTLQ